MSGSGSSLAVVPSWRLGALLRDARGEAGRTLADLAAEQDTFDIATLDRIEAGERALDDDELDAVLALYGVAPDGLVPGRTDLVVDLDRHHLATAGHTRPLAGVAPTADEVLACYLSLVCTLRNTPPGATLPLREADLEVLSRVLALTTPEVQRRLEGLMASPLPEVRHQSRLLRARLLVPAAGVLVAVTAAGALVLVSRTSQPTPRAPDPTASATVDIGGPATRTRGADGSPGPVVVQAPEGGLSGDQVPAGAVGLDDPQVAVRGADGRAVQSAVDDPGAVGATDTTSTTR